MIQRCAKFWFFRKGAGNSFSQNILHMIFQEKCSSCYILLTDHISLSDCLYLWRYWAKCVLQLFVNQICDVINFEINLIFLIKPFFINDQKVENKNSNILRTKWAFNVKIKSIFHHFLKASNCQKFSQTWECTFKLNSAR